MLFERKLDEWKVGVAIDGDGWTGGQIAALPFVKVTLVLYSAGAPCSISWNSITTSIKYLKSGDPCRWIEVEKVQSFLHQIL